MVSQKLDSDGYIEDLRDWNERIASEIARQDNLTLTDAHWEIIVLTRDFYERYQISPATRALTNLVKQELGGKKGTSLYLMKLFGGSPAKMVSKISGLPKPDNCI
tara:strand:+ start:600 stop:914 length:315 start_codon:yes stop_codon:yes gene_type:complete